MQRHTRAGARQDRGDKNGDKKQEAVARLFDETVLLYLRLTSFAMQIYRRGALSGPRRTVLAGLARTGPRTVAQMAKVRAQSRQRLQPLVNALIDDGLVEALPNPAHKHAHLIAITARGRRQIQRMLATESTFRARLTIESSVRRISQSADVLREMRQAVEAQSAELRRSRRV